jgi:hypothetical protein
MTMCRLIDAEDAIGRAGRLVEAIYMAATALGHEEGDAIKAVTIYVEQELGAAKDLLRECRAERAPPAPPNPA